MINIFQDIHTYLIISFLLMVYLLYKFAYKSVDNMISSGINKIKQDISKLNNNKQLLLKQIEDLNASIENADNDMETSIAEAQHKAEQIISKRTEEIQNIIREKKEINTYNYKKLEDDINSRIKQKLTSLIVQKVIEKINTVEDAKSFQIINLQKSIDMLKNFADNNN